ncbi:MAG: hypothetical protein DI534_09515 [Leifsonia xyli]|nr:MAG: hypothetical protein DI534_09515 [Leifsonia xyli]
MTTRRTARALASVLLAAGLATASALPAGASVLAPASGTASRTSIEVTPGSGPVSVAVVVPITLPITTSGLIPSDDLARATGTFGTLTRQLDALAGTHAAIALDPRIVASIRVLGGAAPTSATQWLARLQATSNEVFLLAYGDADVVAAARTGTLGDLTPSGFGFALDPANFSPAVTPAPSAAPDPAPTPAPDPNAAPPFPTTEQVLAWSTTLPRIAWPDSTLGSGDLAPLAAAGYQDLIVSSTAAGDPRAPLVSLDGIQGIVSNSELSTLFADVVGSGVGSTRSTALAALQAALEAASAADPGRGIVLTLGRESASTLGLDDALTLLTDTTSANFVTLDDILATTPVAGSLDAGTTTTDRDEVFASMAQDAASESAFASVLEDPSPLLDERRLERIALYSLGWSDDAADWAAAVAAFHQRSGDILGSVQLVQGSDVALLAKNAEFKVAVSNALPYAITVRVTIDPQSPILRPLKSIELTVEPESTGTALVPVEAVANGEAIVLTSITSPTGVPIDSGHATVAVHAEWEGIGTLAIVIVLVLVFAAGILRIVITRRRARRRAAEEPDAEPAPAGSDD